MGTITYWTMPDPGQRTIFEAPLREEWTGPEPRTLVQDRHSHELSLEPVRWFGRRFHVDAVEMSTSVAEDLFSDKEWVKHTRRVNRWAHQALTRIQNEHFGGEDIHVVFRQGPCYFGSGEGTSFMFTAAIFDRITPIGVDQAKLMGAQPRGPALERHSLAT
jgi:hypothetical protein